MHDLLTALCLIFIIEGLLLLAMPIAWKRMIDQLFSLPIAQVRAIGAATLALAVIGLWSVRH